MQDARPARTGPKRRHGSLNASMLDGARMQRGHPSHQAARVRRERRARWGRAAQSAERCAPAEFPSSAAVLLLDAGARVDTNTIVMMSSTAATASSLGEIHAGRAGRLLEGGIGMRQPREVTYACLRAHYPVTKKRPEPTPGSQPLEYQI